VEEFYPVSSPGRPRPTQFRAWASDIADFLHHGDARQVHLAEQVAIPIGTLNRYLSGKRRPAPDTVVQINQAVGDLLVCPAATAYLNVIAIYSQLFGSKRDYVNALLAPFDDLVAYLKSPKELGAQPNELINAGFVIQRAWRKRIIETLRGAVPDRLWFDVVSEACSQAGFDLSQWLMPSDVLERNRQLDLLVLAVRRSAASLFPKDAAARNRHEVEILQAIQNYQTASGIAPSIIHSAEVNAVNQRGPTTRISPNATHYNLTREFPVTAEPRKSKNRTTR